MSPFANTPPPPYYAVIFSSTRTPVEQGYGETADAMVELAHQQPGFLGVESVRDSDLGITVSYWADLDAIRAWKQQADHQMAQQLGKERWYGNYVTRIAKVERDYSF
ncbi:antibiotic biosynthesis monooxygenase [Simiduia curdlanivorans]|uniref:Antibiotic biosynthesis monooxygenase family protein n=1 Tax=Simiduia curdlanivorans TaxID=1492769 RepID=A0ABV8V4T1_9GAMM|nr:antibiotic biosynthesis monooxygenase [Simiduia curdlanivorans]MDN3640562.1 antibiotic biosynthesis monooxygenase [Simiduia curdlanivorans]